MNSDGDDLFQAILAMPDDDLVRLAYADWLDEQGDEGSSSRAEFIRVQVELHRELNGTVPRWNGRVLDLRARERILLATHRTAWLAPFRGHGEPLRAVGVHGEFRRGFLDVVWMPAAWFLLRAERLFQLAPVRELRVTMLTLRHHMTNLLESPWLAKLDTLEICEWSLWDDLTRLFEASPGTAALRVVRLRGCGLTDVSAERLANLPYEWYPHELDVSHNAISEAGLASLRSRFGAAAIRHN